jgi:exonuclease VII small subunit
MPLWGYIIGRRRRKALWLAASAVTPTNSSVTKSSDSTSFEETVRKFEEMVNKLAEGETTHLTKSHDEKKTFLKEKETALEQGATKVKSWYQERRNRDRETLLGKGFTAVLKSLDKEFGKNVFLMIGVSILLIVDAVIARQIFISLGVSPVSKFVISGKEVPIDLPLLYGVFLTLTVAFTLHLLWPRSKIKTFTTTTKISIIVGGLILILIAGLRLGATLSPSMGASLLEAIMLIGWILGVLAVYWLVGEIVGDETSWFKLMIAFFAPVVVVLLFFFGTLTLLQLIVEWVAKTVCETWFELRKARTVQQERNTDESYHATKKGFHRGLTF